MQHATQAFAPRRKLPEIIDRHPPRLAADLPDTFVHRAAKSVEHRQRGESIVADRHRFDLASVLELRDQRDDAVFRKVDEWNRLVRLEQYFLRPDRDHLRSLEDGLELGRR